VSGDLIQHMLQKGHACSEGTLTGAVQIDDGLDLGLECIALDASDAGWL
jgi:hypothetical protein